MKIFLPIIAIAAFSITANAAVKPGEVRFELKNDSNLFMKDVARLCLSAHDSKVESVGPGHLKLTEKNLECAQEIVTFASQWDQEPAIKTIAVYTKDEKKTEMAKKITEKYEGAVAVEASKNCPCLLLKGPKAEEAANFARQ